MADSLRGLFDCESSFGSRIFFGFWSCTAGQQLATPKTSTCAIEKMTGFLVALGFCSGIIFVGVFRNQILKVAHYPPIAAGIVAGMFGR